MTMIDAVHDVLGFGSGAGTSVPSGAANGAGAWVSLGTPASSWCEFDLFVFSTNAGPRFMIDLSVGAANDIVVSNLVLQPGAAQVQRVRLPVHVPALELFARSRASAATQPLSLAVKGQRRSPGSARGYARAELINADLTTTRPTATTVPLTDTWTEISASLTRTYGALMLCPVGSATNPATAQTASMALGLGGAGAEAEIGRMLLRLAASSTPLIGAPTLIESAAVQGQRLVAKAVAATPGSDTLLAGVMGFY